MTITARIAQVTTAIQELEAQLATLKALQIAVQKQKDRRRDGD